MSSISGISSGTNLYQSQFKQVVQDFSSLQSDLSSGNLSTAQQAYTSLTKDLASVRQTEGIQTGGTSQINTDLAAVGSALQSGDLSGAQSAFATLTQDLQGTQQSQGTQQTYGHHHHHHHGSSQPADASSQTSNTSSQASGTSSQAGSTNSQNAGTSSQAGSTSLSTDLAAVGSALQSGDLSTAQNAFSKLMRDLGNGNAQNTTGTSGNGSIPLSISFTSINITV